MTPWKYLGRIVPDHCLRPCIDFRGLNNITIKNKYPFESLEDARIFTKLDLGNTDYLVRVREGDEWKVAFNTPMALGILSYAFRTY